MVTFKCTQTDCKNANIEYNFLGNPESAECGECKTILEPKDLRDDPPLIDSILGEAE
jgi:hypothetical protein